jgi:hypothetical protein
MPLKFWDEAFLTTTYLINRLPSKTINFDTPYGRLFHTKPTYSSLRVFGCACWPNLRPYNSHKLAFRSTQCVFLGYSSRHKGVKCLEVKTGRVYISRDVVFDETVFPFQSLHPNAGALLRKEILLLPESLQPTSVFDHGGVNNVDQRTNPANTIVSAGVQNFAEEANGENLVQNGENLGQNNGEAGAGSEVDPPVTPGRQSDGSPCRSAPGLMQSGGSGRSASSGSASGGILRTFNQQERDTLQSSSAARTINQQERDTSPTSSAAD